MRNVPPGLRIISAKRVTVSCGLGMEQRVKAERITSTVGFPELESVPPGSVAIADWIMDMSSAPQERMSSELSDSWNPATAAFSRILECMSLLGSTAMKRVTRARSRWFTVCPNAVKKISLISRTISRRVLKTNQLRSPILYHKHLG